MLRMMTTQGGCASACAFCAFSLGLRLPGQSRSIGASPIFAVAYVYFESEPGRRAAANLMTKDEARNIAAGIAKLPELLNASRK